MHIIVSYLTYLFISVMLTVWVARTLHKRGAAFLVDAFHGNAELAASVNHLLVVGFYLINVGFVCLALRTDAVIEDWRQAIELLSAKLGLVMLTLGGMHFFNLYVFSRIRQHGLVGKSAPVAPDAVLRVSPLSQQLR
ncbi:MAG TPA: hypothetical protein VI685_03575 [Candidatus Angelobacter sp.]